MVADRIEREVLIEAPPERVWELLTSAEHVGRWFGDAGAEVDLRPGGALVFHWAEHGSARGRIEVVEAPRRFVYRWAPFGPREGAEPREGNSTRVEFTLRPAEGGTLLHVAETGFATLEGAPEAVEEHFRGNTEGWRIELDELVAYAASAGVR